MATFKTKTPDEFDFAQPSSWPAYKKRFERYADAIDLSKKAGNVQVSTLLYVMGEQSESVFETLTFGSEDDKRKLDVVLTKLDNYFVPKVNRLHEKAVFNRAFQEKGESCEAWLRRLYELSKNCGYTGKEKDSAIMGRFIVGLLDEELSQEIQLRATDDMTLQDCVENVRKFELIKAQRQQRREESKAVEAVSSQNYT